MKAVKLGPKNGEIEFWRFCFSLVIVFHHSRYLVGDKNSLFLGGALAVEFFFIVTGYLLAKSIEKENRTNRSTAHVGTETFRFIKRKIQGLCPEVFISWAVAFVITTIAYNRPFKESVSAFINGFWELILVKMSGLAMGDGVNSVVWYISSMLICMAILYPLIRKYPDMMYHVVVPLIIVLGYGLLFQTYGSLRGGPEVYKANLRALADICVGLVCYQVTMKFRQVNLTIFAKTLITLTKWLIYLVVIYYMNSVYASKQDFFYILLLAIAIVFSFSQQGIETGIYQNRLVFLMGEASLYLFLSHTYWASNLNALFTQDMTNFHKMLVYGICVGINTAILWGFSIVYKRNKNMIKSFVSKLLIK